MSVSCRFRGPAGVEPPSDSETSFASSLTAIGNGSFLSTRSSTKAHPLGCVDSRTPGNGPAKTRSSLRACASARSLATSDAASSAATTGCPTPFQTRWPLYRTSHSSTSGSRAAAWLPRLQTGLFYVGSSLVSSPKGKWASRSWPWARGARLLAPRGLQRFLGVRARTFEALVRNTFGPYASWLLGRLLATHLLLSQGRACRLQLFSPGRHLQLQQPIRVSHIKPFHRVDQGGQTALAGCHAKAGPYRKGR